MKQIVDKLGKSPGAEYTDLIEICGYMEAKQGVSRQLVVEALLSAALSLCGDRKTFFEAAECVGDRYSIG